MRFLICRGTRGCQSSEGRVAGLREGNRAGGISPMRCTQMVSMMGGKIVELYEYYVSCSGCMHAKQTTFKAAFAVWSKTLVFRHVGQHARFTTCVKLGDLGSRRAPRFHGDRVVHHISPVDGTSGRPVLSFLSGLRPDSDRGSFKIESPAG